MALINSRGLAHQGARCSSKCKFLQKKKNLEGIWNEEDGRKRGGLISYQKVFDGWRAVLQIVSPVHSGIADQERANGCHLCFRCFQSFNTVVL